ncbi:MAG: hypothetical protein A2Z28_02920 [Chloroflexi bacterium RBG_16_51_9]|nr:MAG: hypothetical protein A2Z28_02920 [Chloroflexi bacterium RBG_16_51_9]
MAEFLNTSAAYAAIEKIVDTANNKVVLISPYIQIPRPLLARLKYIDGKGKNIVVVCREGDLKADARDDLKQIRNLELRFDENLHAKCYFNEESMVISSLNLYDYSQQNNREMGILLSSKDGNIFAQALKEAEFIVDNAQKDSLRRSLFGFVREATSIIYSAIDDDSKTTGRIKMPRRASNSGFCIRCGTHISQDIDHPLCEEHYKVWAQFKDPDYPEKYCYSCGKKSSTSMAKPECTSCHKSAK